MSAAKLDNEDIQKDMCKALNDIAAGAYKFMEPFVQELFVLGS